MNLEKMKNTCERMQWSTDQIDWDAPGKPTPSEARRFELFLSNISWIEYMAAPAFPLLANASDDENLHQIYLSFGDDEMRHALAQRKLLERWGLLKAGETPTPSASIRTMQEFNEKHFHKMHPSMIAALTPFLEIQLDGAIIPHLVNQVEDPVFHQVFDLINKDEGRHLAVNFQMLGHLEPDDLFTHMGRLLKLGTDVHVLYSLFFGFLPFLGRTMSELYDSGMDHKRVSAMLDKYIEYGKRDSEVAKNAQYQVIRKYAQFLKYDRFRIEGFFADMSEAIDKTVSHSYKLVRGLN